MAASRFSSRWTPRPRRGQCLSWVRTSSCCLASSTPMFTCASRATPTGRASRRRPGPPRPAASRPWWTCRSTASRQPSPLKRSRSSGARPDGQCHVDVGFWGGVIPSNLGSLGPLHEAGVLGFKCFLANSGSEDFPPLNARQVHDALAILRDLGRSSLSMPRVARRWLPSARPTARLCRVPGHAPARPREPGGRRGHRGCARERGHVHIVHLSSSDALPMIASARREGVRLTARHAPITWP